MAEAKTALEKGGPMRATRTIQVNADGSVAAGDQVAFVLAGSGKIQFEAAAGLPSGAGAVFTPYLFGSTTNGQLLIYPNNSQNQPVAPNSQTVGQVASYMIEGPGISQGPYCVVLGGNYMPVQVDASGNLTPPQIRVPNSGLLSFNAAAAITLNVSWTGGGNGPFGGSTTLDVPQGQSTVHVNASDMRFTLAPPSPVANPPGTVKVGSGGGSPLPK
jgi:hypothetical protein